MIKKMKDEISMINTCNSIFTANNGTPVDTEAASIDVAPERTHVGEKFR